MDLIKQLGELALASRMRRLSDRMIQDVSLVHKELDLNFEPRWFTVYYLLLTNSPQSIVDIAKALGVTHPSVNQTATEMIRHGLVKAARDHKDKRKRMLSLTQKGYNYADKLRPLWKSVEQAAHGLTSETGYDVLDVLEKMEQSLDQQSLYARITDNIKSDQLDAVEILDFQPEYRDYFKTLNLEWIEKEFSIEPEDEYLFSHPESEILEKGGHILFARCQNEIVGTCALIKDGERSFHLAKMGVSEAYRGRQIGKKLLQAALEKCREYDADVVTLTTNSKLTAAMNLYRQFGFTCIPMGDHPHQLARSDRMMKLELAGVPA